MSHPVQVKTGLIFTVTLYTSTLFQNTRLLLFRENFGKYRLTLIFFHCYIKKSLNTNQSKTFTLPLNLLLHFCNQLVSAHHGCKTSEQL